VRRDPCLANKMSGEVASAHPNHVRQWWLKGGKIGRRWGGQVERRLTPWDDGIERDAKFPQICAKWR
jgi:hypothetical protein